MSFYKSSFELLALYNDQVKLDRELLKAQIEHEYNYYLSTKINNLTTSDIELLDKLNDEDLASKAKYKYFNGEIIELMGRYTKIAIHLSEDPDNNYSSLLKDIFTNLNKISSDSEYGEAIVSGYKSIKDMFILKIPRKASENLLHEFFVGNQLNTLRSVVSNFAYIYGGFNCNYPKFIEHNTFNFCSNDQNMVKYIIYENIYDSISMFKFAQKCNIDEFLNIFLQIILCLDYANKRLGFVHYDLHGENILIRQFRDYVTLVYPYKNKYLYIKTKNIPFIIDYGFSRVEVNGKIFSYDGGMTRGNIRYSDYNPLFDPFKLLFSVLGRTNFKNYDEGLYILSKFFINSSKEDLKDAIQYLDSRYYEPPNLIKGTNENFIEYIMNTFNMNIPEENIDTYPIYSCISPSICESKEEIIDSKKIPENYMFLFYKMHKEIKQGMIKEEHEKIFNEILSNVNKNINELWKNIDIILNDKIHDITSLVNINYITIDILNYIKKDFLNKYKLNDYINLYVYKMKIMYDILKHFYTLDSKNKELENIINDIKAIIDLFENKTYNTINIKIKIVEDNIKKLKELSIKKHHDDFIEKRIKEDLDFYNLYK